jgi:hypothetical protein
MTDFITPTEAADLVDLMEEMRGMMRHDSSCGPTGCSCRYEPLMVRSRNTLELRERIKDAARVVIPDGMTPWDGSRTGPPEDWANEWKVLHRNGVRGMVNVMSSYFWDHTGDELDIIAYQAKPRVSSMGQTMADNEERRYRDKIGEDAWAMIKEVERDHGMEAARRAARMVDAYLENGTVPKKA